MKKLALITALLTIATSANAQAPQNGGFSGPSIQAITVETAKSMRDDSNIVLVGNITQHLGGEKYTFQDKTGSITVEIDHEKWNGLNVAPTDIVEISGEVDKDWNSVEIDVDRVTKK